MQKIFHWMWLAISILLIAGGVATILNPVATLLSMLWMIGVLLLLSGIYSFVLFSQARRVRPGAGWILFDAVVTTLLAILTLFQPFASVDVLVTLFAVWMMLSGAVKIKQAIDLKNMNLPWGGMLAAGIVSIVFGILAVFRPAVIAITLSIVVGVALTVYGVISLLHWWSAHKIYRRQNRMD